jgi:hypothetical protein
VLGLCKVDSEREVLYVTIEIPLDDFSGTQKYWHSFVIDFKCFCYHQMLDIAMQGIWDYYSRN